MTREKAIEILKEIIDEGWLISDFEKCVAIDACEMAIEALKQEPFMNKPCVSSGVCEHDKMQVLDKIRAEIKALSPEPTAFDVVDGNPIKDAIWETLSDVLMIIDKYRNRK